MSMRCKYLFGAKKKFLFPWQIRKEIVVSSHNMFFAINHCVHINFSAFYIPQMNKNINGTGFFQSPVQIMMFSMSIAYNQCSHITLLYLRFLCIFFR